MKERLLLVIANRYIRTNKPVWHEGQIRAFCQEGLDREIAWVQNLRVTLFVLTAIIRYYKVFYQVTLSVLTAIIRYYNEFYQVTLSVLTAIIRYYKEFHPVWSEGWIKLGSAVNMHLLVLQKVLSQICNSNEHLRITNNNFFFFFLP